MEPGEAVSMSRSPAGGPLGPYVRWTRVGYRGEGLGDKDGGTLAQRVELERVGNPEGELPGVIRRQGRYRWMDEGESRAWPVEVRRVRVQRERG